jgi:hypothetical protein
MANKRREKEEVYAIVDRNFTTNWKPVYRWTTSTTRDFCIHGCHATVEAAVADIPLEIKKIVIQYGEINHTIIRQGNKGDKAMKLLKTTRVFEVTTAELNAIEELAKVRDICPWGLECRLCKHKDTPECGAGNFQLASDIEWNIIPDTVKMSHLMDVNTIQFRDAPARIIAVLAVDADNPDTFYQVCYYNHGHLTYSTVTPNGQWFLGYEPFEGDHAYDVIRRKV